MTNKKLKAKMEGARAEKGLTKKAIHEKTGIAYSTVTKAFREPSHASVAHLMRICDCIGLEYYFGGDGREKR